MAYKLPNPERARTERNRELKKLRKDTEPDRAERAAALSLIFHEDRDINHVMELSQMVLDLDPDGIQRLKTTYLEGITGAEDRMERLAMLANVGRWINHEELEATATDTGVVEAAAWVTEIADEIDQADRLSTVERRFDADVRRAVQKRIG